MLRQLPIQGAVKSYVAQQGACLVYRAMGVFNTAGSTDMYLQLFDATAVPAEGAVPLKSWLVQAGFVYNQHESDGIACVNGAVFVLSSTDVTKTIATAGGDSVDIQVEVEEFQSVPVLPLLTKRNINGTNPPVLVLIADTGVAAKRLSAIVAYLNGSLGVIVDNYIQVFAQAPVSGTSIPILSRKVTIRTNDTFPYQAILDLGQESGLLVQSTDSSLGIHTGIYVAISSTGNIYTAIDSAIVNMSAWYFTSL